MTTDTETRTVTLTEWQWERVKHALFVYKVDALLAKDEFTEVQYSVYGEVLEAVESQTR